MPGLDKGSAKPVNPGTITDPNAIPDGTHWALISALDSGPVAGLTYRAFTDRGVWENAVAAAYRSGVPFKAAQVTPHRPVLKVESTQGPTLRAGGGTAG